MVLSRWLQGFLDKELQRALLQKEKKIDDSGFFPMVALSLISNVESLPKKRM